MHIHILGTAGKMTAPLAVELKRLGHKVTGSDQERIYPPVSTILKNAKIRINNTPINPNIDLIIVGSSYNAFQKTRQEFSQIKKLKIPYISATSYLAQNVAKTNSILVAGAYGKSTISSLLVWIFKNAKNNPSYMFGATALNKIKPLAITDSDWSILEADESINGLDTQAKFLIYPVKHLIITSTQWEHKESYLTHQDNLAAFKKLIQRVPSNGIFIYNPQDKNLVKFVKHCRGQSFPYHQSPHPGLLFGSYNEQNISAAVTLCQKLKINPAVIKNSVKTYLGLKRRLEIVKKNEKNIVLVDDFAQSPHRIKTALRAIKDEFPHHQIKVFLEPHASFLQNKKSLENLSTALKSTKEVLLAKIRYNLSIDKKDRVTAQDFRNQIGNKLIYQPLYPQIPPYYQQTLKPNQVLVHFSSGGKKGLKTLKKISSLVDKL